jgi:hypothetical protein
MGFTNQERINQNSKVLAASVIDANETAQWYESRFLNEFTLDTRKIWTQFDLLRSNPAATQTQAQANVAGPLAGVVDDLSAPINAIRLTPVPGTNNSTFAAYEIFNDVSSDRLDNWLQPQSIPQINGAASIGYAIRLYDGDPNAGGTEILTTDGLTGTGATASVAWIFNYSLGLLFLSADFRGTISSPNNLYILGFRYIGETLADGSFGSVQAIHEEIPVTIPAQTTFNLSSTPVSSAALLMFINQLKVEKTDYSVIGSTINYNGSYLIETDDAVEFQYFVEAFVASGSQTLGQTLLLGNSTDGYDLIVSDGSALLPGNDGYVTVGGGLQVEGDGYVEGDFYIQGKLYVDGAIDPIGLELTPQPSSPGVNTLFVKDDPVTTLQFTNNIGETLPLSFGIVGRVFNVGNHPTFYSSIEDAVSAINSDPTPPSQNNRVTIFIHPGYYSLIAPIIVPEWVTVRGISKTQVFLSNNTSNIFVCNSNVCFEEFSVDGSNNSSVYVFQCNNSNNINIRDVDLLSISGTNTQGFLSQVGSTWNNLVLNSCIVESSRTSGFVNEIQNTAVSARNVNSFVNNVNFDVMSLTSVGGSFNLQGLQSLIIKNSTIRGNSFNIGVNHQSGGVSGIPQIDIRHSYLEGGVPVSGEVGTNYTLIQTDAIGSTTSGTRVLRNSSV